MDGKEATEIPFGAFDSELKGWEYTIPEGMEARIENGKIIVREKESEDERIKNFLIGKFREIGEVWHEYSTKDIIAWLEKQGEKKSSWSEEDETGFHDVMWAIEQARIIAKDENDMGNLWYAENWLKSLKDRVQPQWKPSDEQMDALDNFIYAVNPDTKKYGKIIKSLYDDLKKLKG